MVVRQQPEVAAVVSLAARFGIAGVDHEPVGPGLEPLRVTEAGKEAPGVEQCPLHGVLGQMTVAQDAEGDLLEAAVRSLGDSSEGDLVASLGSSHQSWVHASPGSDA